MPPEASSRPEIGLKRTDTSPSEYGPKGATITLNAFPAARWTSARLPLGAPATSSTAHWPSTVVQPSIPFASKSTRSTGTLSGSLISAGSATARECGVTPNAASSASVALTMCRRDIVALRMGASSVELLGFRLPLGALDERHLGDGMPILQRGHDADRAVALVRLHGLGRGGDERPLGLRHGLPLRLRRGEVLGARERLDLGDLAGRGIDDDLRERGALRGVHGELDGALLELELRGDRLSLARARRQAPLERDLDPAHRLRELRVAVLLGSGRRGDEQEDRQTCEQDHRDLLHVFSLHSGFLLEDRVQTVEHGHAALEQLVIVADRRGHAPERQ